MVRDSAGMERNGSMASTLLPREKCRKPLRGQPAQGVKVREIHMKTAKQLVMPQSNMAPLLRRHVALTVLPQSPGFTPIYF